MVITTIGLTSVLARPIENILIPGTLSPAVRVGGIVLGELSEEEASRRMAALLHSAAAQPIRLIDDGRTWTISPEQLELSYDLEGTFRDAVEKSRQSQGIRKWWNEMLGEPSDPSVDLHFSWNREKAVQLLQEIKQEVDHEPTNAALQTSGQQVRVVPHKTGRVLSVEETLKRIQLSLASLQPERQISLAITETEPEIVTDEVAPIDTLLAEASTEIPDGMITVRDNAEKMTARLHGQILAKHARLSFTAAAGPFLGSSTYATESDPRTLHNTGGIQSGIGQAASTFYWAALKADLTVVERHPHLRPPSYISPGLDAAIWDGKLDLKVENPFEHPVYIEAAINGNRLTIRLYGSSENRSNSEIVVEKVERFQPETVFLLDGSMETWERRVEQTGAEGILAQTYRVMKNHSASVQERKDLVSNDYYRPKPKVIRIGPPAHMLKQNGEEMALYGPMVPVVPDSSGSSNSFAEDPNMAPAEDVPLDIATDPNVVSPSP